METFKLKKYDGTHYEITGKALTPVMNPYHETFVCDASVIQLASGEKVLYVSARPIYYMANKCDDVRRIYRDAQNLSAAQIAELTGRDASKDILAALGISNVEVIA